jgi:hypothetical protein
VVAAHNRVLRRWLRGESGDPQQEIEQALAVVQRTFVRDAPGEPAALVVVPEGVSLRAVEAAVRRAVAGPDEPDAPIQG